VSRCAPRDLSALGSFSSLDSLVLDYNNIEDDPVLPSIPSLRTLSLNSNNVRALPYITTPVLCSVLLA
jgi:Leucine-rich repeat (LRR) protein